MKKYVKTIILSVVLILIIALITVFMISDIDLVFAKCLSIVGIQDKKLDVEETMAKLEDVEAQHTATKKELETAKNNFDVAKEQYENISESDIEAVQQATKEEKYFIEYLWVVLGNYARANNLGINIITPGSTVVDDKGNVISQSAPSGKINIVVVGRYANVADFVFDVENDRELRFKLDNIRITYSGDNKVSATFDILSLNVAK